MTISLIGSDSETSEYFMQGTISWSTVSNLTPTIPSLEIFIVQLIDLEKDETYTLMHDMSND